AVEQERLVVGDQVLIEREGAVRYLDRRVDAVDAVGHFIYVRRPCEPLYQVSWNGRASTSNDHADGFCCVSRKPISATSSGLMKKEAGLLCSAPAWAATRTGRPRR